MRGLFNKIFKLLNLGGRDWGLFFLALLLAFSTWIIHKLSLDYSVYLKVEVVAESNLDGRSMHSTSGTEIMAKCRTTGWRILYAHMTRGRDVVVKFPASVFQQDNLGDERYFVTSDKLHEYADQIFGASVSVEYFVTDKVYFKFKEEIGKTVPVKPVLSLSFDDQYIATGPLTIIPDKVTVYGDPMHLESLDFVSTVPIKQTSINESFSGMVSLKPINGMRFSVNEVHYTMDVSRYLEVTRKAVKVEIEGVPEGVNVIPEPATVNVTMKVQFPLKSDPNTELKAVAQYDDLKSSLSGQIKLQLANKPLGLIKSEISPVAVKVKEVVE